MSILDALERAKQLGLQRQAGAAERSRSPARPRSTSSLVTKAPAAAPLEQVEFAKVAYDPAACAFNHIVVPDVEPHLARMASPPYRMLRARILQRCRANQWTSLAVTSPGPGEGKSVTALNLAISLAREGNNEIFLLDFDMRNPSICRYLGTSPKAQLSQFLAGHAQPADVLFNIGVEKLVIGGNAIGMDDASELLATGRIAELFAFIRRVSVNPLILVDLPPVLVTDDALVVAPNVDAIMLVVSEGQTRRDGFQRTMELLAEFPVAGVVLNQSHESLGGDYYGGSYS